MRNKMIDLIFSISKEITSFDILEKSLNKLTKKQLSDNIVNCGVMPEVFEHDSSEEKMWAKYSDILLSKFFQFVGYQSEVLGARGNSADVFAKNDGFSIVGDAKTFRLSRTAKNQKDFKVQALDSWRQKNNYSILASPLFQYPNKTSQIYEQAISKNVCLISYTHLKFILDDTSSKNIIDLEKIFNIGNILKSKTSKKEYNKASIYWKKMDELIAGVMNKTIAELEIFKDDTITKTKELGEEGITYWENKIEEYKRLPKEKAIELLIKAHKIEQKIKQIRKAVNIKI